MARISQLVDRTLESGYLTIETENRLRQLFGKENNLADIDALVVLQRAIAGGAVKREFCTAIDSRTPDAMPSVTS